MFDCTEKEFNVASNIIDSIVYLMEEAPKEDVDKLMDYLKERMQQ